MVVGGRACFIEALAEASCRDLMVVSSCSTRPLSLVIACGKTMSQVMVVI